MDEGALHPFGVSARTGRPLPELEDDAVRAMLTGEKEETAEKRALAERDDAAAAAFGVTGGLDPNDLRQVGWGVVFAPDVDQAIKDALAPLLEHRRKLGAAPFVVFDGASGYRAGDTAESWLARHRVRLDVVDPDQGVPFYLAIVGSPDTIPFEFQYVLDIYWGVGRIWFDTPDAFRRYADSVVKYETDPQVPTTRQLAIFAPEHDFDAATQLFNRQVAAPMVMGEGAAPVPIGTRQNFQLRDFLADKATKATLTKLLRGEIDGGPPSLLFTGGHGMAFEHDDPTQLAVQGALVCQDWGGHGSIDSSHWFAANDLPDDAHVHGLIHCLFACHGGGCTQFDNFDRLNNAPRTIAPKPFFSRLPQAMLSHKNGGALAVLAHIERAWAYSFQGARGSSQTQGFRDVIGRLLRGERIGQATDPFNVRWAALSTALADLHVNLLHGVEVPLKRLGQLWVARDDARNFMILGDPAVRLREEHLRPIA